jgi:hypothetical protein
MSNTYTFNNLNFTAELMQDADFVQSIEESINDHLPMTADFDYKYCIDTNTLQVNINCDLSVEQLADLADCYSELLLMPQAFA